MTLKTSRCAWSMLLFCCCLSPLTAAVIYVNQFATGNNTGLSWADAHTDLQLALAAAQPGDEVWVAAGTYYPTSGADRYASFGLPAGVSLYGGFTGSESSLEARDWLANLSVLDGDIGNPSIWAFWRDIICGLPVRLPFFLSQSSLFYQIESGNISLILFSRK